MSGAEINGGRSASRARPLAALAAVAALLAGCAGIPTSGPVGTVEIGGDDGGGELLTLAEGPQPGDTPDRLLTGFLIAQRAPQQNYSVAREFLTSDFRAEWSPTARVLISDTPIVVQGGPEEDRLEVNVNVGAFVDATGVYTELPRAEAQELPYTFEKNADGEWRIASAPEGILLTSARFMSTFGTYPLYFFDPGWRGLVPDVRWFPNTASRADRIVKELLAGPSPWYGNGVLVSAFPSGTKLDPGVEVSSGTATVALAGDIASQDAAARWRMQEQLRLSLSALSDVVSVEVTVGGFPVEAGSGQPTESSYPVSADPLGLTERGFGYLTASTVDAVPGISARVEALGALGATLARGGAQAAVRTAAGVWSVSADADPLLVDTRAGLVDPSIDRDGFVWSAVASDPGSILAFDAGGGAHEVGSPHVDGAIVSLDVSRDGARLLLGTRGPNGSALTLVGIVRDAAGVPIGLGTPLALPISSSPLLDAAWADSSTVVTLSESGSETQVDLYRIGGRHDSLGSLEGGAQLVGGNAADGVRVRADDGTVWRRNSSGGWQSTGIVASFLATQQ
ncbi:GerMN domain-containing protein [Protaetiibacter sp. SSC-01]|uniref:LpqB family beta-propeller domain-containing protein n=1 Tax=Protaetiibacter sp. SSC-01 TaxID=2759943 RepID=UPI001657117F|nr:LpqB family beta-propeller domain-containing protein [Protaetiibacter sp. SSC-01]QNO37007.1 GerMN domain-containing protein [Protaetiibacter sp. SSC-01]